MPSIEDSLVKDEKIKYKTQEHWIIFVTPVILFVIGFVCYFYEYYLHTVALLLYFAGLFFAINSLITYVFSEFAVTNQRVFIKRGMLSQTVMGIMLSKIESIQVRQSIPGRLFNYGDIDIIGTGSTDDHISQVRSPYEFRKAVMEAMGNS